MAKLYVQKTESHCLECGSELGYGRPDRKFCCPRCRFEYHNHTKRPALNMRNRVMKTLEHNYSILMDLVSSGVGSISLGHLAAMGYDINCVTTAVKVGKHMEMGIFDIRYVQTEARISGIRNVSLNLSPRTKSTP